MILDFLTLTGAFVSSSCYAYVLDRFQRRYEPRWTWLTVVGGVALVGSWVAMRIALGIPGATPWEVWLLGLWHFVAAGLPIIFWQSWQDRDMLAAALDRALKERDSERNTTKAAAPMDAAAGGNTERDRGPGSGDRTDGR